MPDKKHVIMIPGSRKNSLLGLLADVAAIRRRCVLQIPETFYFDPAKKWGPGFTFAKHEAGMYLPDQRNVRFAGKELDLACVILRSFMEPRAEGNISGDARQKQLEETSRSYIRLGIKVFLQILQHEERVPVAWRRTPAVGSITICFDGDYFMDPEYRIVVPTITLSGKDMFDGYKYVDEPFSSTDCSALWPVATPEVVHC